MAISESEDRHGSSELLKAIVAREKNGGIQFCVRVLVSKTARTRSLDILMVSVGHEFCVLPLCY